MPARNRLTLSLVLSLCCLLVASPCAAFTGSGAGSVGSPFQITNCSQLQEMSSDLSAYYVLANDIDCSATLKVYHDARYPSDAPILNPTCKNL